MKELCIVSYLTLGVRSITDSVPALYHRSIRLYVLLHFWKVKIHCLLLRKRIEIFKEIDVCLFNIVQTF